MARAIDETKFSDAGREMLNVIRPRSIGINAWPPRYEVADFETTTPEEDALVRQQAVRAATQFIEKHAESDDFSVRCQVECIKFLLFQFQYVNARQYVSTQQVIETLSRAVGEKVTRDTFRLQVIAKLRDAGVIVASSNKGYKIPLSVRDLLDFVEHGRTIIQPMLGRLNVARPKIRLASKNTLDILGDDRFATLRRLVEVTEEAAALRDPHEP